MSQTFGFRRSAARHPAAAGGRGRSGACFLAAVLIAFVIAGLCASASAGPREDAYAAVEQWAAAFNAGDVEKVVAAYAPDALMFGTGSPKLGATADDRRAYFTPALAKQFKVTLRQSSAKVLAEDVVAFVGFYDFSRVVNGATKSYPSRFTFVTQRRNGAWTIVHHHSAPVPKPLAP